MKKQRVFLLLTALLQTWSNNAASSEDTLGHDEITSQLSLRDNRFPSIEERVKLYMSNWYVPPCSGQERGFIGYTYEASSGVEWRSLKVFAYQQHPLVNATQALEFENIITPDMAFFLNDDIVANCALSDFDKTTETDKRRLQLAKRIKFRANMRMYCHDVKGSFMPAWHHVQWEDTASAAPPALLQFGDNKNSHKFGAVNIPLVKKFRSSYAHPRELRKVTSAECYSTPRDAMLTVHGGDRFQPIVWKLATHRHYAKLYQVSRQDTVWDEKKDMAIFRGQLTGSQEGYNKHLSDEENCRRLKRCRLVYNHGNSTLIDARLTSTRGRLPDILNGVPLQSKKIDLTDIMEYKGIIMIEGNDVASGLKWALLSQSVVLMPPPKHTSWAMEELLEPWLHYIPLDEFATNVEERMQWIVDNDVEARKIAEASTLWMEDLVFHPDAAEDDRLVQEEILRRYRAHFKPV